MKDRNIHRTDKSGGFTVVDNRLIKDRRLSFGAKGLALVLLERPDDWKIYARDMVKRSSDGRATLGKYLDELEELGYLSRRRVRGNQGRFKGWDVQFYESPEFNPLFNKSLTINRITEIGEARIGDTVFGETEIGATEIGKSAPTKDGLGPNPDLNQKRTEIKTDGTAGDSHENREKTAAAAAEFFKILDVISGEMAKPLQAPETLIENLQTRGETPQSTKQAWLVCKTNARKPSGAFVYWLKSGYLPQQNSNFKAKIGENPPPSSAPPPPTISSDIVRLKQETAEERKARAAAELAAMKARTSKQTQEQGGHSKVGSQEDRQEHSTQQDQETARARRKAELAAILAKARGGSR